MKGIISIVIKIVAMGSVLYAIVNIINASKMPESAGLGAFAKQGAGLIYFGLGVVLYFLHYVLKKKGVL